MFSVIVFLIVLVRGSESLQWSHSLQNDAVLTACEGTNLSLPWDITLAQGETIVDIQWLFEGDHSNELIAISARGHFVAMAPYSQRAQLLGDVGLSLTHAAEWDAGNYSIEITVHGPAGALSMARRTAHVYVISERIATNEVTVIVRRESTLVHVQNTDQFHVQLTCTGQGNLLDDVVWTTPSGSKMSSTSDQNGQFRLLIPNPVETGNYTCAVTPGNRLTSCLPSNAPVLRGDSVYVDGMQARMEILERENMHLRDQLSGFQGVCCYHCVTPG